MMMINISLHPPRDQEISSLIQLLVNAVYLIRPELTLHSLKLINLAGGQNLEQCLCTSCGCCRCITLPLIVFMRICIIANASDDNTRKVIHQACSFHFNAEDVVVELLVELVAKDSVLDYLAARCNQAAVDHHIVFSWTSLDHPVLITRATIVSLFVVIT